MKAGALNVTLINYRNTDALDGVLGAARNTLLCPRCVPGLFRDSGLPCPFLALEAMVERSLFRAKINSGYTDFVARVALEVVDSSW